jgi:F-type H+-transporting ATPase subunit gamma
MPATKEIKRRIKSVKNTKKITKAMELVAASKMKRAVSSTLASRAYAKYSWEVLESISNAVVEHSHPLLTERAGNRTLVVLISSNRGLCGAYNAQIIRAVMVMLREDPDRKIDFVTVGRKGDTAMRRIGQNIIASFTELPETIHLQNTIPISNLILDLYKENSYDKIYVAYTDFKSALSQKPTIKQVLPIQDEDIRKEIDELKETAPHEAEEKTTYLFEPSYDTLITQLVDKIARMQIYQMILESAASEQSSRMVAMKNASEAAGEMIQDLTLVFNKARQASITQEISEISAGMASVS